MTLTSKPISTLSVCLSVSVCLSICPRVCMSVCINIMNHKNGCFSRVNGGSRGRRPPQQDPILLFLLKSAHIGGRRPPNGSAPPPNGKSWIRCCVLYTYHFRTLSQEDRSTSLRRSWDGDNYQAGKTIENHEKVEFLAHLVYQPKSLIRSCFVRRVSASLAS